MTSSALVTRLNGICAQVGFDLLSVKPFVLARLELLGALSPIIDDAECMTSQAFAVFRHYEEQKRDRLFDADERRVVVIGCMLSDIGKTGPLAADAKAQRLVAEMFSVEGVENDNQTVKAFCKKFFPADSEDRIWTFETLDLDPAMSIRTFWNLHSRWTLDILRAGGVPPEIVAAAATHHLLEGINPDEIVGDDQRYTLPFGGNHAFDRAEKLVIVLDKYDAARRRGRLSHPKAIAWVRNRVQAHPDFCDDAELATLIDEVEALAPGCYRASVSPRE